MNNRWVLAGIFAVLSFSALVTARADPSRSGISQIHICTQLPPVRLVVKGAVRNKCVWQKHQLKVRFLEGDPVVQERVEKRAHQWTQYSGVTFVFGDDPNPDIRITFNPNGGSWSCIGSCIPCRPSDDATMNFGWLTATTDDTEYDRVVLHEFGHALGLVHEHQNPAGGIEWNVPKVYEYYREADGWDDATIRRNIFEKYSRDETNYTRFDPHSIMIYAIPHGLTLNGFQVDSNTQLSQMDKDFIHQVYEEP